MNIYLPADDLQKREELSNKYIYTGDIVKIYNRSSNMYLSVQNRNINQYFYDKKYIVESKLNNSNEI